MIRKWNNVSRKLIVLGWLSLATGIGLSAESHPNVLLILVDDLKPAIGAYGDPVAHTPNIDRLIERGMRFENAYCNQAVCAPSRMNLMLGSRSSSTGLYRLDQNLRVTLPDAVTLPQYMSQHGYHSESLGKVFHIGHGNLGDPQSFDEPHLGDKVIEYLDPKSTQGGQLTREEAYFSNQELDRIAELPRGAAFESPDVQDDAYADGRVAEEAVRRLERAGTRYRKDGTPFFIAVGFARPHLPFSVPEKYWNLYDPEALPMPQNPNPPRNAPAVAIKKRGEITNYAPVPENGVVGQALARKLIHGYYAGVSYTDAQIGKVTAALKRLDLEKDTIVVLWGDHGFHLGDLGIWTKHTNYEQANHIPLVFVAPGVTQPGSASPQLAETVDIYPTIAELAGLPRPGGPQPIDGLSLVPVLNDPHLLIRDHAYHVFPRGKFGQAIRTDRYRLVKWTPYPDKPGEIEYELYDYLEDPFETQNLAEKRPDTVQRLSEILNLHPEPMPLH